ncbi:substrate-binding periplasmic protein [Planctobacterium marinum]|uniref:Solute-binding protein family 3/N-terminal domain-containing protein n=1 Tax=Planctobacterium marinum TaxID=1631968 RepID=A0AA48KSC7_9ALTE|nr:hypothetical protein MACH26_25280 [Planctobacterium marinum]
MIRPIVFMVFMLSSVFLPAAAEMEEDTARPDNFEIITIASGEQPPHTSKFAPHFGYLNHVIKVAFAQQGKQVNFVFFPWSRAYKNTVEGEYVASSYWYNDPRHLEFFLASEPLRGERVVFFRKKSSLDINSFNDVKRLRLRVGLTRGYTYMEDLWRYARENAGLVSVVNTELQNFKMLLLGRIDVFPAEEISGWYTLNKHFGAEQVRTLETLDNELFSRNAHLMFSKAHPDAERLLAVFNQGMASAKDAGLLEQLEEDFITGKYTSSAKLDDLQDTEVNGHEDLNQP